MTYIVPNFGQYGYVQPKSKTNWVLMLLIGGMIAVMIFLIYKFFKEKEVVQKTQPESQDAHSTKQYHLV